MTQESLLTVLIVTGAWVVLELLKYAYAQLLIAATKRKEENARAESPQAERSNPGNSAMSAGELRTQLSEIKGLLREARDAAIGAKAYAKQTLDEMKKRGG